MQQQSITRIAPAEDLTLRVYHSDDMKPSHVFDLCEVSAVDIESGGAASSSFAVTVRFSDGRDQKYYVPTLREATEMRDNINRTAPGIYARMFPNETFAWSVPPRKSLGYVAEGSRVAAHSTATATHSNVVAATGIDEEEEAHDDFLEEEDDERVKNAELNGVAAEMMAAFNALKAESTAAADGKGGAVAPVKTASAAQPIQIIHTAAAHPPTAAKPAAAPATAPAATSATTAAAATAARAAGKTSAAGHTAASSEAAAWPATIGGGNGAASAPFHFAGGAMAGLSPALQAQYQHAMMAQAIQQLQAHQQQQQQRYLADATAGEAGSTAAASAAAAAASSAHMHLLTPGTQPVTRNDFFALQEKTREDLDLLARRMPTEVAEAVADHVSVRADIPDQIVNSVAHKLTAQMSSDISKTVGKELTAMVHNQMVTLRGDVQVELTRSLSTGGGGVKAGNGASTSSATADSVLSAAEGRIYGRIESLQSSLDTVVKAAAAGTVSDMRGQLAGVKDSIDSLLPKLAGMQAAHEARMVSKVTTAQSSMGNMMPVFTAAAASGGGQHTGSSTSTTPSHFHHLHAHGGATLTDTALAAMANNSSTSLELLRMMSTSLAGMVPSVNDTAKMTEEVRAALGSVAAASKSTADAIPALTASVDTVAGQGEATIKEVHGVSDKVGWLAAAIDTSVQVQGSRLESMGRDLKDSAAWSKAAKEVVGGVVERVDKLVREVEASSVHSSATVAGIHAAVQSALKNQESLSAAVRDMMMAQEGGDDGTGTGLVKCVADIKTRLHSLAEVELSSRNAETAAKEAVEAIKHASITPGVVDWIAGQMVPAINHAIECGVGGEVAGLRERVTSLEGKVDTMTTILTRVESSIHTLLMGTGHTYTPGPVASQPGSRPGTPAQPVAAGGQYLRAQPTANMLSSPKPAAGSNAGGDIVHGVASDMSALQSQYRNLMLMAAPIRVDLQRITGVPEGPRFLFRIPEEYKSDPDVAAKMRRLSELELHLGKIRQAMDVNTTGGGGQTTGGEVSEGRGNGAAAYAAAPSAASPAVGHQQQQPQPQRGFTPVIAGASATSSSAYASRASPSRAPAGQTSSSPSAGKQQQQQQQQAGEQAIGYAARYTTATNQAGQQQIPRQFDSRAAVTMIPSHLPAHLQQQYSFEHIAGGAALQQVPALAVGRSASPTRQMAAGGRTTAPYGVPAGGRRSSQ